MEHLPENVASSPGENVDADYWHFNKARTKRCLKRSIVVILLLLPAAAVLIPLYSDYSSRTRIIRLYGMMAMLARQLAENPQAEIDPTLIDSLPSIPLAKGGVPFRYKAITRDGTMIVISDQAGVLITFHPEFAMGEWKWSCQISSLRSNNLKLGACSIHDLTDED
ncbi:MAG: hypothetical protein LBC37_03830 [Zoogloeaceae bacterium]|jgi:hypothetical protein|nr:hypothetical protein [Zoogloeaceae bacterium]